MYEWFEWFAQTCKPLLYCNYINIFTGVNTELGVSRGRQTLFRAQLVVSTSFYNFIASCYRKELCWHQSSALVINFNSNLSDNL